MATKWSQHELSVLTQNLVDEFPVQQMMELIPDRSEGAITQKAQEYGFGVITSKEDGITRFYLGLKRRQGEERIVATNDVQVAVAAPVPTLFAEPRRIIANNGLEANSLAVQFLQEHRFPVEPENVYMLSSYIRKGLV